jgi:hypothetical protein
VATSIITARCETVWNWNESIYDIQLRVSLKLELCDLMQRIDYFRINALFEYKLVQSLPAVKISRTFLVLRMRVNTLAWSVPRQVQLPKFIDPPWSEQTLNSQTYFKIFLCALIVRYSHQPACQFTLAVNGTVIYTCRHALIKFTVHFVAPQTSHNTKACASQLLIAVRITACTTWQLSIVEKWVVHYW